MGNDIMDTAAALNDHKIKLYKPDFSISFEELLDVAFSAVVGDVSDVETLSWHFRRVLVLLIR
jgi:hypothetical protein